MGFTDSIKTCIRKYIDFSGRAPRSEYWWFVLLTFGLGFIPVLGWILRLVLLLPSLSVQVRRLHDMNRSAWWLLALLPPITLFGAIVLLIMSAFPGTPGPNRYGPNPLPNQPATPGGPDPYQPYSPPPPPLTSQPTSGNRGSYFDPDPSQPPAGVPPQPEGSRRQYCTQCGTQLQSDARFCTLCGTAV